MTICTRRFEHRDIAQLLEMMRQLAIFEGYIDQFCVTAEDLQRFGLVDPPLFDAIVAYDSEGDSQLFGMAVYYTIPWTFTLKPTLVLKELYIKTSQRGRGIGTALFESLTRSAQAIGAFRINWTVVQGNENAMHFYRKMGGLPDTKWQNWTLEL
jgi:GNAT superfamily N-acetyltransferase